jgi:hypothetical protein
MVNFRLGIGDILLLFVADREGVHPVPSVELPLNVLANYRNNSEEYKKFVDWIVPKLFKVKIEWKKNCSVNRLANIQKCNWEPARNFFIPPRIFGEMPALPLSEKFIVVSTKFRFDDDRDAKSYKEKVQFWAKNFESSVPIVLLGEQQLQNNLEVQMWGHDTVYQELLHLRGKNTVIDLTVYSCNNTPDPGLFLRDIWILSKAESSYGFGYGGNFVLSTLFCKRTSFMIGNIKYNWAVFKNHVGLTLCKTFDEWIESTG